MPRSRRSKTLVFLEESRSFQGKRTKGAKEKRSVGDIETKKGPFAGEVREEGASLVLGHSRHIRS